MSEPKRERDGYQIENKGGNRGDKLGKPISKDVTFSAPIVKSKKVVPTGKLPKGGGFLGSKD